jgi:hypothetical protein
MMTTFWRIEAGGKCLSVTHKLDDIRLSRVFLFDDETVRGQARMRHWRLVR